MKRLRVVELFEPTLAPAPVTCEAPFEAVLPEITIAPIGLLATQLVISAPASGVDEPRLGFTRTFAALTGRPATTAGSVTVADRLVRDDPAAGEHPGHATQLLPMTAELLAQAGVAWAALERVAVGRGQGRFTGLRVGLAAIKGLAEVLHKPIVTVSVLQAVASAALATQGIWEADAKANVLAVLDALFVVVHRQGATRGA